MNEIKKVQHRSVTYFEDAPCYQTRELVRLHGLVRQLREETDEQRQQELLKELTQAMDSLKKLPGAPERLSVAGGQNAAVRCVPGKSGISL